MVEIDEWRRVTPQQLCAAPEAYSFSWPEPALARELAPALERHGVLRPLLCWPAAEGGLRVVSGHRRLEWALRTGLSVAPVAVVNRCAPASLWNLLLADANDHRSLNPVEVGLYLHRRMSHTKESIEELAPKVFPSLGLPPRVGAAEDVLWVGALPREHRDGFAAGSRPLHSARLLRGASRSDALAVLSATAGLAGGVNKFTELARTLLECAWRDRRPVQEWIREQGLDREWGGLDDFRAEVRRRRYPRLSRWEAEFPAAVASIGLPTEVSIQPPRSFEGGRYQCRMGFSSLQQLRSAVDGVRDCLAQGRFSELGEYLE